MPLFLLRDGSIRRFRVLPEGLSTFQYTDRFQRRVHALLEARQEAVLREAQPTPTRPLRHRATRVRSESGNQAA
jgi:hypothetical protein